MGFIKGTAKMAGKAFSGIGGASIAGVKMAGKTGASTIGNAMATRGTAIVAGAAGAGLIGAGLAAADGNASVTNTAAKGALTGATAGIASGTAATGLAYAGTGIASAGAVGAGAMYSLGNKMVSLPDKLSLATTGDIKATMFGKAALFTGGLAEGAIKAKDELYRSRMGQHDGMSRGPTPVIPQELRGGNQGQFNNAGAEGDLVFALNNLRRGR